MLRKLAAERDVTLTELDLRWGITEEEAKSGKVVEICLREIENSIPFFIGIIGNRYGWTPNRSDLTEYTTEQFPMVKDYLENHLSVTEMEMQFGVLEREEDMHAYFYIKEQKEDADNPEMLNRLKEEVFKSKYPSSSYKSPEDLAAQVEEAFINLLNSLFPDGNLSELEKERIGQRSFLNQLCQNYIKDEKNFDALDSWLADEDSHQFVVTGASGLGKSALIANWLKEKLTDNNCEYNIIYHFTGNGGSESSSEHITKSIANEIKDIYGWEDDELGSETKLEDLFIKVSFEGGKPLLIVIDAINQIVDVDNAKLLNWLPVPTKGIKILFSTLEDDRTMEVFKHREYPIFTLQPLDIERRSQLVRNYLKLYAKSLTEKQIERIVSDFQCENTLVLKTLLDELVNFGIYEKLDERINYYLAAETIEDFYQALLASYEEEYGRDYVETILSIIAISKHGLTEQEILSIVEGTPLAWSQLYCSFAGQLVSKKGIISFSHLYIRDTVTHRYLDSDDKSAKYRKLIIASFKRGDSPREWEELLHQYYRLGDTQALSAILQKVRIFNSMVKEHVEEMALYVRSMINEGFDPFKYKDLLLNEDGVNRAYSLFLSFFIQYFSLYEFGLALCEDYQNTLEDKGCKLTNDESFEKLYIWKGIINRSLSKYSEAIEAFSKAYQVCEKRYGTNHLHTSHALKHIGTIYNAQKDYDKSEEYYLRALDIQRKLSAQKEQIDTIHSLADNCLDKRDFDRAENYLMEALSATLNLLGNDNDTISSIYNSLGALYDFTGKYEESINYATKSLDLDSKLYGRYNVNTAHSYHNIAGTYCNIGKYDEAQKAYEDSIEIKTKLFGKDHYETCISLAGLGNVYKYKKEYDKAIECHTKYYEAYKLTFGNKDSYLAVILAGIGTDFYEKGDYQNALCYHKKATEILLSSNEDVVSSYYNCIGNDLYCLDNYEEAIDAYQNGMKCIDAEANPYTMSILLNCVARSYACIGQYQKAKTYFEDALEIRKKLFNENDPRVIQCINNVDKINEILTDY
jgi:preprotein translocase subunit SecA/nephrocystin-3